MVNDRLGVKEGFRHLQLTMPSLSYALDICSS